ncbi:Phage holin family protein OS=Streptomyces alboniger OX=132473 GN=CP975_30390 PE=4 SV=1 [Streptomyces alboniger]
MAGCSPVRAGGVGSHGGLGGAQSHPFLLSPLALPDPAPDGRPLVGAERIHGVLRDWLGEDVGPEIPLSADPAEYSVPVDESPSGATDSTAFTVVDQAGQDKTR